LNLRELIALAIARGDLKHSAIKETDADRIGALAFSDPLGAALWRILWDHDHGALSVAGKLLADRVRGDKSKPAPPIIRALCNLVLLEYLNDKCPKCAGRRFTIAETAVQRCCSACDSTGLARHSDVKRCRAMGFDRQTYHKWKSKFCLAHVKLTDADADTAKEVGMQLERNREPAPQPVAAPALNAPKPVVVPVAKVDRAAEKAAYANYHNAGLAKLLVARPAPVQTRGNAQIR
jgi:hypothetical protein